MSENKSFLRNVIGEYMAELGERYNDIVVVNAELAGTCRNKSFVEKYPERSFNTGITEQNMVSFGEGLACEGFKPYVFSMAPFLTMRACEQCRTDVAYGNRDVKMIGVFLCAGVVVQYALEAANNIKDKTGKDIRVVDMYSNKPVDEETVICAADTGRIVIAQDHNVYGGLGTMVAKVIAENNLNTKFVNVGVKDEFVAMAHANYLYHYFGMDAEGLERTMLSLLRED